MKGNRPAPGRGDQDPAKPHAPHSGASHWQAHTLGASWVLPLSLPRAFQEPPTPAVPAGPAAPRWPLAPTSGDVAATSQRVGREGSRVRCGPEATPSWKDRGPQMASPSRKALAPAPQTPTARCPACRPLQGTEPDAGAPCPSAALSCPCAAPWGPSLHALREPSAPSWADHQSKVSGRPPGCLSRFPGAARPALPAGPQDGSHPGQAAAAAASAASSGSSMVGGGAAGAVMWHSGLGPGRSALGLPPPTSGVGLQPGARTAGGGGGPTGAALPRTAPPPGPGAPPPFPVSHLRGWEPTSNPRAAPSPVPDRRA